VRGDPAGIAGDSPWESAELRHSATHSDSSASSKLCRGPSAPRQPFAFPQGKRKALALRLEGQTFRGRRRSR
jgi:hypothetical protein